MNTIVKILLYLAKALNYWFIVIPINLNILATLSYIGILYLMFGTANMQEIQRIFDGGGILYNLVGFVFVIPSLLSFFSFLSPEFEIGNRFNGALNSAIAHRNNMMYNTDPKSAYNIMKKTSHLDMMASNSDNSAFNNAKMGFNAEVGNDSPSSIYNNLMNK